MSTIIADAKVDFWIKNNLNVLLRGSKGVGKSAIVISAFERHGLRWKYFSAATLDPWVDFIGVPKEVIDEDGNRYLDLVRPKAFQFDEVDAIFIDEFNRAHKKVRNAIMELMQFKSINGKKFNNLRFIWAAINPYDPEKAESEQDYDVEKLDPAQEDRFQIIYDMPNNVDRSYFIKKYGNTGSIGCDWWQKLSNELKDKISPRRLDYMLEVFTNGGDVRDTIPGNVSVNIRDFVDQLKNGSILTRVAQVTQVSDVAAFLQSDPRVLQYIVSKVVDMIKDRPEVMLAILPHVDDENVVNMLSSVSKAKDQRVIDFAQKNILGNPKFYDLCINMHKSKLSKSKIMDSILAMQKAHAAKNPPVRNKISADSTVTGIAKSIVNQINNLTTTRPNTYFKDEVFRTMQKFIDSLPTTTKKSTFSIDDSALVSDLNSALVQFVNMYQAGSLSGFTTGSAYGNKNTRKKTLDAFCALLGVTYIGNRHGLTP